MRFTDIFIKRPVLAISLSFLIALLGFQAIFKMQVREYPEVINTVITVNTSYYGASSDLIQGFITQPLEQAVAQADNIDFMTSSSQLGSSTVTAYMKLNTDPNAALSDILAKVNSVRSQLPKEAEDPSVTSSTGSTTAVTSSIGHSHVHGTEIEVAFVVLLPWQVEPVKHMRSTRINLVGHRITCCGVLLRQLHTRLRQGHVILLT